MEEGTAGTSDITIKSEPLSDGYCDTETAVSDVKFDEITLESVKMEENDDYQRVGNYSKGDIAMVDVKTEVDDFVGTRGLGNYSAGDDFKHRQQPQQYKFTKEPPVINGTDVLLDEATAKNVRMESTIDGGSTVLGVYRCVSKSALTNHIKIHTGEKPFSCTLCDFRCSRKGNLTNHIKIHTGEKPFSCDHCGSRFSRKFHLTTHMRKHTGEKPLSCTLCNYRCVLKTTLINHVRLHTVEKPFSCDYCGSRFSRKCHLTMHMRIHPVEKPFTCAHCNYRCLLESTFINHMRVHTGEKPFSVIIVVSNVPKNSP